MSALPLELFENERGEFGDGADISLYSSKMGGWVIGYVLKLPSLGI